MNNRIKHYIYIYLKRNACLDLAITIPLVLLFLIVSMIYDASTYDMFVCICSTFGAGIIVFLCSALYILRFTRMIKLQEKLFDIQFNDINAKALFKGSVTYISQDWFIHSGSCAFYRSYIKSLSYKTYTGRGGGGCKVKIKAVDGKVYKFWLMSTVDIKKLCKWRKNEL